MKKFTVAIWDNSCMQRRAAEECGHRHRTLSGAMACRKKLAKHWPDGSHNSWAHFGEVAEVRSDGNIVILSEDDERELRGLEETEYTEKWQRAKYGL
jgi:hypothetical protein